MATEVISIIDPDNGTGTDYTSLSAWEGGEQGDLTGARDEIAVAKCRCTGGTADPITNGMIIDGWTTSATQYIKIWTDPAEAYRHSGKWSTGNKYRGESTGQFVLWIKENYVRVEGIQFKQTFTSNGGAIVTVEQTDNGTADVRISKNIFWCVCSSSASAVGFNTYNIQSATWVFNVFNNVFIDCINGSSGNGIAYAGTSSTSLIYAYNNTFYNCYTGIYADVSNKITAKNNLFGSCGTPASGTYASGSGYNATDDASIGYTVTGGATGDRVSQTITFVDAANDDFHLASTDAGARNYGVSDPGSGLFSDDIDGETRSGSWDIGADEYVAAAASMIPPRNMRRFQHLLAR